MADEIQDPNVKKLQELYDMREHLPPEQRRQVESVYAQMNQRGQYRVLSTEVGRGKPVPEGYTGPNTPPPTFDMRPDSPLTSGVGEFVKQSAIPLITGGAAAYFGGPIAVGPGAAGGEIINQMLGITPPSATSVLMNLVDPALGQGGVKLAQNAPRAIPGFAVGAQQYNANRARMMHETHIPGTPQSTAEIDAQYKAVSALEAAGDNPTVSMGRVKDTVGKHLAYESDLPPGELQSGPITSLATSVDEDINRRGIKTYPNAVSTVRPNQAAHVANYSTPSDAEADLIAQRRNSQGSSGVVRTSSGEYVTVPNPMQETSISQLSKQQQPSSPYQPDTGPPAPTSPMGLWQQDVLSNPETNSHILGNPPIPPEGQAVDLDTHPITSQITHPAQEQIRRPGFLQTAEERTAQRTPVTQSAEARAQQMKGAPSTVREKVQRVQQGESMTDQGIDDLLDGIVEGTKRGELRKTADELIVEHGLPFSTVRKIIKRVGERVGTTRAEGGEVHGFYKDLYSSYMHSIDELPQTGAVKAFKEANRATRVKMARDELKTFIEKHVIGTVQEGHEQPNWNKLITFLRDPENDFWRETFKDQPEVLQGMHDLAKELVKTPRVPVARGLPIGSGRRIATAGFGAGVGKAVGDFFGLPYGEYAGSAASLGLGEAISHFVTGSPATQKRLLSIVQANTGNWQNAAALISAGATAGSNVGAYLDNPKAKKQQAKKPGPGN